jgi:hypothetical protein
MPSKRTPSRVSQHSKRARVIAPSLDDAFWSDEPMPVSKIKVPLCCVIKTCTKHSLTPAPEQTGTTERSLLCEETLS